MSPALACSYPILGPNPGEMIVEGFLALEYGVRSKDVARTTHAHVGVFFATSHLVAPWLMDVVP
jgi:hypothetical protein